ncbi:putative regulator of ribonuclease activity [Cupriavidus taiwanensis]|uniref:4-hydroxy-4-methyl-2-oxoglutarate aldolase n=1 Tax=Cupriavidus taiwanensis TaxID=164546 RepID=A0A375EFX5_9BURK|nr:ribonuclease E activity regulator RraA [Cupriavidus taiwanensis]SOZ73138.1 putative regulator of ribonuclease activity [Cupriavidus taiwanensis]SOZ73707.1 putative regulator of ribonuclease activity [Cupriavidus taiwanensis]SOZ75278.1 putative regulator of ribonuclease activity [Cupriavidus taiwanensis]SPA03760.1 putative regulator of ribonuclease activity [Cupriavidus taiwanensis]SPA12582.1 putative regulator of ribonuclease activity [Cupriavidus taiwanensis]
MTLKTTDLCDKLMEDARVFKPVFHDFGAVTTFEGEAVTVKCFEDNSRIKELSATPGTGKVLVVDGGGSDRCALLGDIIAADLAKNGWAGAVIYGHVRDKDVLAGITLGIKALGCMPMKSLKRNEGTVGATVDMAGQRVRPGEYIYADADGILVVDAPITL